MNEGEAIVLAKVAGERAHLRQRLTVLRREISYLVDAPELELAMRLANIRIALKTDEHLAERLGVEV